jgi:hypothetical protein
MTDEIERLQADNAALRDALFGLYATAGVPISDMEPDRLNSALDEASAVLFNDHPGADLIAERDKLRAEVERLKQEADWGNPEGMRTSNTSGEPSDNPWRYCSTFRMPEEEVMR